MEARKDPRKTTTFKAKPMAVLAMAALMAPGALAGEFDPPAVAWEWVPLDETAEVGALVQTLQGQAPGGPLQALASCLVQGRMVVLAPGTPPPDLDTLVGQAVAAQHNNTRCLLEYACATAPVDLGVDCKMPLWGCIDVIVSDNCFVCASFTAATVSFLFDIPKDKFVQGVASWAGETFQDVAGNPTKYSYTTAFPLGYDMDNDNLGPGYLTMGWATGGNAVC